MLLAIAVVVVVAAALSADWTSIWMIFGSAAQRRGCGWSMGMWSYMAVLLLPGLVRHQWWLLFGVFPVGIFSDINMTKRDEILARYAWTALLCSELFAFAMHETPTTWAWALATAIAGLGTASYFFEWRDYHATLVAAMRQYLEIHTNRAPMLTDEQWAAFHAIMTRDRSDPKDTRSERIFWEERFDKFADAQEGEIWRDGEDRWQIAACSYDAAYGREVLYPATALSLLTVVFAVSLYHST